MRSLKYILSLILFPLFTFLVHAQDYESSYNNKPISLGITFSPNISWLRYGDSQVSENNLKIGYSYGLLADLGFADNYYFSTGLFITDLRSESKHSFSTGDGGREVLDNYRLQYAEIPLAIKLKSTQRYHRSYYGQFGFTTGIKVSSTRQRDSFYGSENGADAQKENLGTGAPILRLGLQVGGGVEWQLDHNLKFMTGLSFNNGFTRVIKEGDARNSYVAFNFGILF